MKYLITESKINQIILDYLNNNCAPDDKSGWGPKLHRDKYKRAVKKYGGYEFYYNNVLAYVYFSYLKNDRMEIRLEVYEWFDDQKLSPFFGDLWKPIFKKWFEDNTGLKVEKLVVRP